MLTCYYKIYHKIVYSQYDISNISNDNKRNIAKASTSPEMSKKGLDRGPGQLRLGAGRYWAEDLESRRLAGLVGRSCGGAGQNGMGVMLTAGFGCPATLASTTPLLFCTT